MALTSALLAARRARGRVVVVALAMGAAVTLSAPVAALAAPTVSGCPVFPADNVWNTDISTLPVNAHSAAWLGNMGGGGNLHPDFGSSGDPSAPYGIPFIVVDGSHPRVPVTFTYASESDPGPYPLGPETPIEGGANATGDRHALMVDQSSCTLYELYDTHYGQGGSTAGSGAVFNLRANGPLRPATWTSADAAGLPILPGLLRPDEVQAGSVRHAIRFTAQSTDQRFIWPARHQAGSSSNANLPPMGARFRLRASFDVTRFHGPAQAVLTAMKRYGLILADNGSNWYFQGAASNGWDDTMISELKTIPASAFDAIDESSLMIDVNSGQARQAASIGGAGPGRAGSRPLPGIPVATPPAAVAAPAPVTPDRPSQRQVESPAAPGPAGSRRPGTPSLASVTSTLPPALVGAGGAGLLLAVATGAAWLVRRRSH